MAIRSTTAHWAQQIKSHLEKSADGPQNLEENLLMGIVYISLKSLISVLWTATATSWKLETTGPQQCNATKEDKMQLNFLQRAVHCSVNIHLSVHLVQLFRLYIWTVLWRKVLSLIMFATCYVQKCTSVQWAVCKIAKSYVHTLLWRKSKSLIMVATGKQSQAFCLIGWPIKSWLIST